MIGPSSPQSLGWPNSPTSPGFRSNAESSASEEVDPNVLEIGLPGQPNIAISANQPIRIGGVYRSVAIFIFGTNGTNHPFIVAAKVDPSIPTTEDFQSALQQAQQAGTIQHVEYACPEFSDLYGLFLQGVLRGSIGPAVSIHYEHYESVELRRRLWSFIATQGSNNVQRELI